jgi:glycosyltransferase involved in cell wall biosynthesis
MKGYPPEKYYSDPCSTYNPHEMYRIMDEFTQENFSDQPKNYEEMQSWVLLPPMHYEGKLLKGLLVSSSMELLLDKRPETSELFYTVTSPRCQGIPWSESSDILLYTYDNPDRKQWFYETYPHRHSQVLLPFEHEVDFINEAHVRPSWAYVDRDIDLMCVSRLFPQKHGWMIIEAASTYVRKYQPDKPFHMVFVIGSEFDEQFKGISENEATEFKKMQAAILAAPDNMTVELIQRCDHATLIELYSHSKLYCMGSLIEGKNRSQREAMYCNTPVVLFDKMNQYIRGPEPLIPKDAGLTAPEFTIDSLADTFHQVYAHYDRFSPRKAALSVYGRKRYFNAMVQGVPDYVNDIPDLLEVDPYDNLWLDLAIHANYQLSLHDFLYTRHFEHGYAHGLEASLKLVDKSLELFDVPILSNATRYQARIKPTSAPVLKS